jgi:hypothetical protein
MYNNPCEHCENLGHCMHMMNMPMCNNHMMNMPMTNMPMMNMPMMNMPMHEVPMLDEEDDDNDNDLKRLYPKIYIRIYPMVKHHCDMMEAMHGTMYCPSKEELDHISEEMCDMYEEHHKDDHDDDDDDCKDDDKRQGRRHGRRRAIDDLIRILFIRELHGRRRRRRRPHHGYGY